MTDITNIAIVKAVKNKLLQSLKTV